jgi:hypothetical protein
MTSSSCARAVIARRRTHEQQAQQATAQQIGNLKKAFSVCMEVKDYMVKF